jgi:hypothetical protein
MTFKDAFELFGYTWWFPLIQDFCFVFLLTRQSGYLEMVGIYYLSEFLVNTSNTPLHIIKTMREDF